MGLLEKYSKRTVVSTLQTPHELTLQPKLCQSACKASPSNRLSDRF